MTAITYSRNLGWAFACSVGILSVAAQTFAAPPQRLSREALLDKIRGGWAGQMIGVAYGAKTEFKSNAKIGDWELTSDFLISAENDLAHLGCLSGQFVDQSRTGFRVAESGLG
jgi:hypothetical protein